MNEKSVPPPNINEDYRWLRVDRSDVLVGGGCAVATFGVGMIYTPAAVILAGLLLVGWGVVADLLPRKPENPENN